MRARRYVRQVRACPGIKDIKAGSFLATRNWTSATVAVAPPIRVCCRCGWTSAWACCHSVAMVWTRMNAVECRWTTRRDWSYEIPRSECFWRERALQYAFGFHPANTPHRSLPSPRQGRAGGCYVVVAFARLTPYQTSVRSR
jgi:hypothetical protein